MNNLLDGIEEILLMGPGPSCVHDLVYEALSKKSIGHLDPYFIRIMDAIKHDLRILLNTDNTLHQELVDGLEAMGLSMLVAPENRLPMLNSVRVPDGVDEAGVRSTLLKDYKIEIGAGLGPLAGKIWRIGLMGHTARHENVHRLLSALKTILS